MINKIEANYPEAFVLEGDIERSEKYYGWEDSRRAAIQTSIQQQEGMNEYYQAAADAFSTVCSNENFVYSPLNIYIAMALLAEISAGNTKEQILNALKVEGMDTLRNRVKALWDANYVNTPFVKSLLANSLWMRDDIKYNDEVLKKASEDYCASSYIGEMGADEMNHELQDWTNRNTGGHLSEYVKDMELDPETVLGLVSTIFFKAAWTDAFDKKKTMQEVFHGANGDTQVQMMHMNLNTDICTRENFRAAQLYLNHSGSVYFFLPKNGVNAADIMRDPEALSIIRHTGDQRSEYLNVNISVPRFKVKNSISIQDSMERLGITDAFNRNTADFAQITDDSSEVWIDSATHSAMVEVDEEGVTGAAYTAYFVTGAGFPEEETVFMLDRPFCFSVVSSDRSILFSGVVQTIE